MGETSNSLSDESCYHVSTTNYYQQYEREHYMILQWNKCYDLMRSRCLRAWHGLDKKERTIDLIKVYVELDVTMGYLREVWAERQIKCLLS